MASSSARTSRAKKKPIADLSEMDAYVQGLADGSIYVAESTRQAARRHLDDLERSKSPDFPYRFDRERAAKVIRFCHQLKHAKGDLAGQPIRLHPWAQFFAASLFGWVTKVGETRRFRQAMAWVPRGNAKSMLLSALSLYAAFVEGGQADAFSIATTKEQARIVWGDAATMARTAPELCRRIGVEPLALSIQQVSTNSSFKPLAAKDTSLDGLNVSWAVVDEVHVVTRAVWDVIVTACGKRANSTVVAISTAGMDSASLGREQWAYCKQVLNGDVEDELTFALVFEAPEGDSPYEEKTWQAANPMYGSAVRPEIIRAAAEKARVVPSARAAFLVKHLNIWTATRSPWMSMQAWDKCADPTLTLDAFRGHPCYIGLDLATRSDIAAKVLIFPQEPGGDFDYAVFCTSYLPEAVVEEGRNAAYKGWAEAGWIKPTPGNVTDFAFVREDILADRDAFDVREVCFDPWAAAQLASELQTEGLQMVEVRPTVKMLSEPMKAIEASALAGRLRQVGDPCLRWQVSNVTSRADAAGNVFPRKENDAQKIDGAVAMMTAMARAVVSANASPYSPTRGLLTLDDDDED